MAHHFAIGLGAFRVGHVLLKLCLHQGGSVKSPNSLLSAPPVDSRLIFPQMSTYQRAYLGVKITIAPVHPVRNHAILRFLIMLKVNCDRGSPHFLML